MTLVKFATALLTSSPVPVQLRQSSALPDVVHATAVGRTSRPRYSGRYGRARYPAASASRR